MNEIDSTRSWFDVAGQIPLNSQPNPEQIAFYIGMQLEELNEKLRLILGETACSAHIDKLAEDFKYGRNTMHVQGAMMSHAEEVLDADVDLMWVTIGSAAAQGADLRGAYQEVARANWDKFPNGVVTRDPETGKVIKPQGWQGPNLAPFVNAEFRG